MGAIKRIALLVFAVATVLGVGYLAILWFAWGPVMPAALWLADQQWFFIVEAVLLGIVLVGTIALLVWAIAAPGTSSRLLIERADGEVDISKDAIVSTARNTVEAHRGLTAKDIRMKIVGKGDPKLRLRIKVDPGRNGMLEQLGSRLTDEVSASVNALTGHPIDKLRITFAKPDVAHAKNGSVSQTAYTSNSASQAYAPQSAVPVSNVSQVSNMTVEEMADEAVAGSEGASLNTAAALAR
ncbi:alkaline shock response membrane anchor protein AmaP [Raoultibacter phocaeensis]|uniref:alkaline shock response membrane anchor protein AmaP n=1 Tax=Raoultibacter phocaeensis TaxID=2479841 RepID=UPI0015D5E5BF|nr:alkaline shock response membrane anchor protein AmaP [Raoultibacter phocaeensis]